jgi:hypothetical protein
VVYVYMQNPAARVGAGKGELPWKRIYPES